MRNTQKVKLFLKKWKSQKLPCKDILYDYKSICTNLLFEDEDLVIQTVDLLKTNIYLWAKENSKIYKNLDGIVTKKELDNKKEWYVNSLKREVGYMRTSGSTTGEPFIYLRWEPFLYFIEGTNHYDLIANEFNISKTPNILYFFNTMNVKEGECIFVKENSDNFMEHHGIERKAITHFPNYTMQQENENDFFAYLLDYIKKVNFDIIFAPGPNINSLCNYVKKFKFTGKLCSLLSNSNEMLLSTDAKFLLSNKLVDNICDHMRCWDGGASFFTCKDKNYHLLDNLSWCEEIDKKLISTCYFSLPSPFVRFWNGDLCRIQDKYQRCDCGRLYRDFEFLENRPFSVKGNSLKQYRQQILDKGIQNLKQLRCNQDRIEIISNKELLAEDKKYIQELLSKFKLYFLIEEHG